MLEKVPMYSRSLTSPDISSPLFICLCHIWFTLKRKWGQGSWQEGRWRDIPTTRKNGLATSVDGTIMMDFRVCALCTPTVQVGLHATDNKLYSLYIVPLSMCTYYAIPDYLFFLCKLKLTEWRNCISFVYSWSWRGYKQDQPMVLVSNTDPLHSTRLYCIVQLWHWPNFSLYMNAA
jgi:hypothetical protein